MRKQAIATMMICGAVGVGGCGAGADAKGAPSESDVAETIETTTSALGAGAAPDSMWEGRFGGLETWLFAGQGLRASHCYYTLRMQADGNLVTYTPGNAQVVWTTNTEGGPKYVRFQWDGNFVIYDFAGRVAWATNNWAEDDTHIIMQDDGNLVQYAGDWAFWYSDTERGQRSAVCPNETLYKTVVYTRTNLPGSDYKYWNNVKDAYACGAICADESPTKGGQCRAFTYVESTKQCWLKNTTNITASSYTGATSGKLVTR